MPSSGRRRSHAASDVLPLRRHTGTFRLARRTAGRTGPALRRLYCERYPSSHRRREWPRGSGGPGGRRNLATARPPGTAGGGQLGRPPRPLVRPDWRSKRLLASCATAGAGEDRSGSGQSPALGITMNQSVPFTDLAAMTRDIRPAVDRAWENLLNSSQFVGGGAVEEFERAWASYCG